MTSEFATSSAEAPEPTGSRTPIWSRVAQFGVVGLFVTMIVAFSLARPEQFTTWSNARAILFQAAIVAVLATGLTIVLVIGEFDLSFDVSTALSGAVIVSLLANHGAPVALAIVVGICAGALVGVVNGILVAYGKAPAFIATLAVASVGAGVMSWMTDDQTIFGVPDSYIALATRSVIGIPMFIWISVGIVLGMTALLRYTVYGRRAHAVGSNAVAAGSAGIRTARVRFTAFVLMGALAGVAGLLLTAQGGGSSPTDSGGLLLPTYTAVFLGASALGRGSFNVLGTYLGVLFLGTLATGLTMLQQPRWVANVITGVVLIGAILLRVRGRPR